MTKTKVICLYGGPGTGKSTNAARLFTYLKDQGREVELVNEYVKQWAWEGRQPKTLDQFYIFAKQAQKEYSLFGKVDFLVTDCPIPVCSFYASRYCGPRMGALFAEMMAVYFQECQELGVVHSHVFLDRVKPFSSLGRFHDEKEAREIDSSLRGFMDSWLLPYESYEGSKVGMKTFLTEHNLWREPNAQEY